ncbi:LysR family transcriptional regulator [Ornithinimicrobium sp. Y1847]|uniref:LysR family transcriptional regulator n=1 Tax=Ornithinimicrobium sp. Y1847 TaxID=3405419 RepID=UPI003B677C23
MDVQALRWFQQVADGVTVTEVSELDMVSQPGVSRALARLEAEVGTPLLQRSGRVLRVTRAGAAFKRHVDAVLHHLDDGLAAVEQLIDPETGTVTLAFQPSLGTWLVPDLVRSFRDAHPQVRLDLRTKVDEQHLAVGRGSDVDLELSTLGPGPDREWRALAQEPIRALLPLEHPLAEQVDLDLADLAEDDFVLPGHTSLMRWQAEELCRRAGFEPRVILTAADLPTLRGYVAAGLGVALAPTQWESAGRDQLPSTRLRVLGLRDAGAVRDIGMSWSLERRLLPAAELFRTHVQDRARAGRLPRPVPVR